MTVGEALVSPTRTYTPIIFDIFKEYPSTTLHGIVHNSGGGQTKCLHLGDNIHYIKNNLMPVPPIFKLIQQEVKEDWGNMYKTFNCGSRMELIVDKEYIDDIISMAEKYRVNAQVVGRCKKTDGPNKLTIKSEHGKFQYALKA